MTVEKIEKEENFSYWKLFEYCFSWIKTQQGQKQVLRTAGLLIAVNLVSAVLFVITGIGLDPTKELVEASNEQVIVSIFAFVSWLLAVIYAWTLFAVEALKQTKLGNEKLDFKKVLGFLWLNITVSAYAFLSLKDPKFLAILAAGLFLFIGGEGSLIQIAGIVLLVAYVGVVCYHIIRLTVVDVVFLAKPITVKRAVEESYATTKGKAWKTSNALAVMVAAMMIVSIAVGVIFLIPTLAITYLKLQPTAEIVYMLQTIAGSVKIATATGIFIYGTIYVYSKLSLSKEPRMDGGK